MGPRALVPSLFVLFAPSAAHALQTTGDCASLANPPAGNYACTGDVTVKGEWLKLLDRDYIIQGNLTLDNGYVQLKRNLTVVGNLSVSNSSAFHIAGTVTLTVQQTTGLSDGQFAVAGSASLYIAGLSRVTVRASSMTLEKGTNVYTERDDSLRTSRCGEGQGGGGYYGGGGASHGGPGSDGTDGRGSTQIYGVIDVPSEPGSCGGSASSGGGGTDAYAGGVGGPAIRLQVASGLKVDGSLGADGTLGNCISLCSYPCPCDYFGGAGSGGSIWIEAGTLSGSGSIHANGGMGGADSGEYAGSGGGGRVAIYAAPGFAGTITASGGASNGRNRAGGDGTVFFSPPWPSSADGGAVPSDAATTDSTILDAALSVEAQAFEAGAWDVVGDSPSTRDVAVYLDMAGYVADGPSVDLPPSDGAVLAEAPGVAANTDAPLGPDLSPSVADAGLRPDDAMLSDAAPNGELSPIDGNTEAGATGNRAKSGGCGCSLGGNTRNPKALVTSMAVLLLLTMRLWARRKVVDRCPAPAGSCRWRDTRHHLAGTSDAPCSK